MKIVTQDGRAFGGTPLQIVQGMRNIAFGVNEYNVRQYIDWLVGNAQRADGVELEVQGDTDEELARISCTGARPRWPRPQGVIRKS